MQQQGCRLGDLGRKCLGFAEHKSDVSRYYRSSDGSRRPDVKGDMVKIQKEQYLAIRSGKPQYCR
jgi:hypothetical protein